MNSIIQSVKFKLKTTKEQKDFLKSYFIEYAKAVNFFLEKVPSLGGNKFNNISREKQRGICSNCRKKTDLKFIEKDNTKVRLCGSCYDLLYGRKALYATSGRKRGRYDVRDAARLKGTEYALAFQRSQSTIRSLKALHWEWKKRFWREEFRLRKLEEVRDNKIINVGEGDKTKKVKARVIVIKKEKQRVDRYKHYYDSEKYPGYTLSALSGFIKEHSRRVDGLKRRFLKQPTFRGDVVDLHQTAFKLLGLSQLRLTLNGARYEFSFWSDDVRNKKSADFLKEKVNLIKIGKPRYPLLLQKSGEFYLQYPVLISIDIPNPDKKFRAMGIDRGEKMIAVSAVVDKEGGKPHDISFIRGTDILVPKQKYEKIRKKIQQKFTGLQARSSRSAKFRKRAQNISRYRLHRVAKNLVQIAIANKPIVIVMERIKGIREDRGFRVARTKQQKERNYMLSNFVYFTLQKLIEYKAFNQGIPVLYVDPKNTSQLCWKCGNFGTKGKTRFRCKACKNQIHPDLNAAINVANKFYDL